MMDKRGFTLMEMLVVVAIIAMLASILFPVFVKAQEKGRQVACLNNQRQLMMAATMWAQDHDETYPSPDVFWTHCAQSLPAQTLLCPTQEAAVTSHPNESPSTGTPPATNDYLMSSFVAGRAIGAVPTPSEEFFTADADIQPGMINTHVLNTPTDISFRHAEAFIASFCDGHVELLRALPPLWIIDIANLGEFEREVHENSYPIVLYFNEEYIKQFAVVAFTELYTRPKFARLCRGKAKLVIVEISNYPQLIEPYRLPPCDVGGNYPVAIMIDRYGNEVSRTRGFTIGLNEWRSDWPRMVNEMEQQLKVLLQK